MYRDFTYVDDLVRGIRLLIDAVPERPASRGEVDEGDRLAPGRTQGDRRGDDTAHPSDCGGLP